MDLQLHNKAAVITGGSKGLGLVIVDRLFATNLTAGVMHWTQVLGELIRELRGDPQQDRGKVINLASMVGLIGTRGMARVKELLFSLRGPWQSNGLGNASMLTRPLRPVLRLI